MSGSAGVQTDAAPLLELEGLGLRVGAFALRNVSLRLGGGDYLVLLGPSGCGKTTLLRAIAGYYRTGADVIRLSGRPVGNVPPHKRGVGYVAQTVDLFPHMDVAHNVAFGLRYLRLPRRERRRRLDRIVDLLGLRPLLERHPAMLSGGESKRASLARSLVVEPRILLLDEPLSMLDPNARAAMLGTLRTIHRELGTATIHVTHEREEAWALAERGPDGREAGRVAVMRDGVIEQAGPVEELFRRPGSRFVAEFLGGANVFAATFERGEAVLEWGRFALAGPAGFERGWVQIRPESLVAVPEGGQGAVTGTVRSVSDRGIYRELTVELPGGHALRVHVAGASAPTARPGEAIHLRCATPPHPIQGTDDA